MNTSNSLLLDMNLHFLCRSNFTYKNGLNPIALRITYRGERREILTRLSCEKNNWFADVQQVNPRSRLAAQTNKELFNILHKVTERFQELKYSGVDFTMDELVDKIRGKEAPPQSLTEYMDLKMEELQQRIRVDLAVPSDLFLLACLTGMAYADIKGLKGSDFVTDPDGTQYFHGSMQETGIVSIIPLLPAVISHIGN